MKALTAYLFGWLLVAGTVHAQAPDSPGVFDQDEILQVTIATDYATLLADIGEERQQHEGIISYAENNQTVTVPLKLKTRGKFRRDSSNCNFPPLRLNFAKKENAATIFRDLDKVKLVTHCQNDNEQYEQYVVQEYLLYRVYNQLSNASFRVRLLEITYKDTSGKHEPLTTLGFLIEDEELMAERQKGKVFESKEIDDPKLDYEQLTLLYLFEYMIGNIDWSVPIQHNMKLVGKTPKSKITPVPYDFDHAGVIDTEYADEAPRIGTASLRYQLFREFCRSEKELKPFFKLFNEKRDMIYELYLNQEELTDETRHRSLRHYKRFYRVINDAESVKKTFVNPCQQNG